MRYLSLKSGSRGKVRGPLFVKALAWLQIKLAKATGVFPGEEMLLAAELSKSRKIDTFLIDMDYPRIVSNLRRVPFLEKVKVFFTFLKGLDLKEIPERDMVEKVLERMEKSLPNLYNVLVERRNLYMFYWIKRILQDHDNLVVVVGIGHVKGLKDLLKRWNKEILLNEV